MQRVSELEAALSASRKAEQDAAATAARLEGRAAVAEGALKSAESQLGAGLSELQAQHTAALAAAREQHARELTTARENGEAAAAAARAAVDAELKRLAGDKASLEAALRREQARARELQAQLDKEGPRQEAVREVARHSAALQAQLDRAQVGGWGGWAPVLHCLMHGGRPACFDLACELECPTLHLATASLALPCPPFPGIFLQAAVQEEKRRTYKASQAAEAAVAQERALADKAAAEAQQRMQVRTVFVCHLQPHGAAAEGCRWHCVRGT